MPYRQLYRAMDQLERWQRQLKDENVPAPFASVVCVLMQSAAEAGRGGSLTCHRKRISTIQPMGIMSRIRTDRFASIPTARILGKQAGSRRKSPRKSPDSLT